MTCLQKYQLFILTAVLTIICNVCCDDFSLCKPSISTDDSIASVNDGSVSETVPKIVSCPRPNDPPEFSACCYDKHFENESVAEGFEPVSFTTFRCCTRHAEQSLFSFVSNNVAITTAVCLTALLLMVTLITLICCFWWRCPLYMMCRIRYRPEDIIAYDSIDDETRRLNGMPSEQKKGIKIYSPNAVKITMRDDF